MATRQKRNRSRPHERRYRISYRPRIAVLMCEPGKHRNRLLNLGGSKSMGGLENQHQGEISHNAKSKMTNCILWLDASAQFKWCYSKATDKWFRWRLNFIHLTLPTQKSLPDKFIKKLLNQFFLYAYRKTGLRSYVWKAEPQERGEIHFHITSDCFIWKVTLQNIWNGLLRKHGLLGTHENPPSTRVHPTHNIKEMSAYLIKYMTKNDKHRRKISGRLWGASRNLSQAKNISLSFPESEALNEFAAIKTLPQDHKIYEWLQVKYMSPVYFESLPECELSNKYREKINSIRKGYAPTKNFFYDENGQPISYEQAQQKNLPTAQKHIYELQTLFN